MAQGVRPVDAGVTVGQVFLGKYRVDSIIGHGGMGVVAECTHLALNERVAIKMLRQDVLLDQDAVQRFMREAQAAVKLKSEYVARVSDVGMFESGVPYMVMEFLEGHDLGQLLEERGVLAMPWATELMLQTCEALAEAHSLGIVHRDVKPTNLFVTWRPDGTSLVKVLDFGISKSPMGTDMQLTQTQSLLGTPAYMSPEQMRSARLVDSRSDIWSLGTVFYEVLEGRRPFEAESFSEMCVKVAVDAPAPMVNTPPALQQVILRCLAKQPEQRYANMAELAQDLVPFVNDQHGAQRLVDRMTRMLRRAQHTWDADTSNRTPPAADRSARVRTPVPWGAGSDPAGRAWDGQSEPFGVAMKSPFPGRDNKDPSQPFVRADPSEPHVSAPSTIMTTPRRRRWPIVLVLLALAGSAIAVGVVLTKNEDTPEPKPTETTAAKPEHVTAPATTGSAVGPDVTTKVESPVKPVAGVGSAEVKVDVGAGSADVVKPVAGAGSGTLAHPTLHRPAGTKPTGKIKVIKKDDGKLEPTEAGGAKPDTTKPDTTKTDTTKTVKPDTPTKVEPPKSNEPPCDPFKSNHGCPAR